MAASTDINLSDYLTLDGGPLLPPPRQAAASNPSEPPPSFHTLQSRFSDYHQALLKAKNDLLAASPEDVAIAARKCQDIIVSGFFIFIFIFIYRLYHMSSAFLPRDDHRDETNTTRAARGLAT